MTEPRKRGRKTVEEEVQDWLKSQGKQLEDLPDVEIEVPDELQMLEEFKAALYVQMKSGELKGSNLVNGLKHVASMAEAYLAAHPPEVVVVEEGIDEVLADIGLPRARRIDLGRQEIERLRSRVDDLQLVVARLEGEA